MREQRHSSRSPAIPLPSGQHQALALQDTSTPPLSQPSSSRVRPEVRSSPFKSFINPPSTSLSEIPAFENQPLAAHQAATVGLSKEQKQLLWTWSLSFQCVVNVGVRGSETVRTRVVEAGVVPVIISVLGGYLHEMERIRQQSEARERARRKAALIIASQTSSNSSLNRSLSPADILRPPRPVLSPRTLLNPNSRPTQNLLALTAPTRSTNPTGLATSVTNARPSPPRLSISGRRSSMTSTPLNNSPTQSHAPSTSQHNATAQLSARSDGSGTIGPHPTQHELNPIAINSSTDSVFRTGSISPSSVSSSSSLETSRLLTAHLNPAQHDLVRTITPDTLQSTSVGGSGSEVEMRDPSVPQPDQTTENQAEVESMDENDTHENVDDVVMELDGDSEPGPSNLSSRDLNNARHQTRRATIKGNRRASVVRITPLGPPPTTVTDLDDRSFSSHADNGDTPMEGIETDDTAAAVANVTPNANRELFTNHQTPRASSHPLPTPSTITQRQVHPPARHDTDRQSEDNEDVTMAGPSDRPLTRSDLRYLLNDSPPQISPTRTRPENEDGPASPQLQRIFSEASVSDPPTDFPGRPLPPANLPTIPITVTNAGTPPIPITTGATAPIANPTLQNPASPTTSSGSSMSLGFRDEDVLLALQLLAYLSKYPHVRAYFHEPASRATLELTYGSMLEATRALARFIGRYKSDRNERERAKEAIIAAGGGPNAGHPSARRSASMQLPSGDWAGGLPAGGASGSLPGSFTTPPNRNPVSEGQHSRLHRATSTNVMRDRMSRTEAYELAFSNREPVYTAGPPSDRANSASGRNGPNQTSQPPPPVVTYYLADHEDLNHPRASASHSSTSSSRIQPQPINPLATNVFSYVERFTHRRPSTDSHTPVIPTEIQYWAGVIMRNACRKDDERGGIRQCANMQCGKWETYPREFAKCRRCRKAKYCSKPCQSKAWQLGHRFWCCIKSDFENANETAAGAHEAVANNNATTDEIQAETITAPIVPTVQREVIEATENETITPMGDERRPMISGNTSTGSVTRAGSVNEEPMMIVPQPQPTIEPAQVVDAAIARLRTRRSTITLVRNIETPPDQEIAVGIAGINAGLVEAANRAVLEANNGPPDDDERNRARRMIEQRDEEDETVVSVPPPVQAGTNPNNNHTNRNGRM
ncbi:uncharacterized protein MELLADRAFT_114804 [Melampsora larici-populina 98AG31]|uniref:MYND-type domain-containing protein n=1 Tax=Melampsora larici-populina (strain 98AG31 / pathotype 3-4-7) TaxID=747676 RepID=F4R3D1_MELLP|nr:uncharacterized protein MELLADRAFT_114804 [Melampsora larici-populina 98AG31]EGG13190.1 hypothetical protein MELLADRAFT_114804 [Melampsora larici-populina 98AG31]